MTTPPYVTSIEKKPSFLLSAPTVSAVTLADNGDWAALNARHLETAVVAFADGHVKSLKNDSWYKPNWEALGDFIGSP